MGSETRHCNDQVIFCGVPTLAGKWQGVAVVAVVAQIYSWGSSVVNTSVCM